MELVDEDSRKHNQNSEEIRQVRNGKNKEIMQEEEHFEKVGSKEKNWLTHEKVTPKVKKNKSKEMDKNTEKDRTTKVDNGRTKKYLDKLDVKEKTPDGDSEKENHDKDKNMEEDNFQNDKENSYEEQNENTSTKKCISFSSNSSLYFSSRSLERFSQTPSCSSEDNYPSETSPVFEIHTKLSAIDLVGKEKFHSEDSPKDTSCTDEFPLRKLFMKTKKEEATSTEEYPNDTSYSKKSSTDVSSEDDTDATLHSSVSKKLRLSSGVDQNMPHPEELTNSSSSKRVSRRRSRKRYRKRYPRKQFRTKYVLRSYDKPRRRYRRKPHPIIKFRNPESDAGDTSEVEENPKSSNDNYCYKLRDSSHGNGGAEEKKIAANSSKSFENEDDYCKRICGKRIVSYMSMESKTLKNLESVCSLDTGVNSISLGSNTDCPLDGYTATAMSNSDYDVIVEDYEEVVVETEFNYVAQRDHKSESDKIAELCDMIDDGPGRVRTDEVNDEEAFITKENSSDDGKMDIGMKSRKKKFEESRGPESERDSKQKRAKTENLSDENGNWQ